MAWVALIPVNRKEAWPWDLVDELKRHAKEIHDRVKELETENTGIAADLGGLEGVES